jgi:hypothetical protein
MGKGDSTMF